METSRKSRGRRSNEGDFEHSDPEESDGKVDDDDEQKKSESSAEGDSDDESKEPGPSSSDSGDGNQEDDASYPSAAALAKEVRGVNQMKSRALVEQVLLLTIRFAVRSRRLPLSPAALLFRPRAPRHPSRLRSVARVLVLPPQRRQREDVPQARLLEGAPPLHLEQAGPVQRRCHCEA